MTSSNWLKSTYCGQGESCVHIAADPTGQVLLTESGDPTGTILTTTPPAFDALARTLKQQRPS
jgi:hypothetical protein